MREQPDNGPNLFSPAGSRKYLNAAERRRFVEAAQCTPSPMRLFCLTFVGAARAFRKCWP
jgi:hypothetical protein